MTVPPRGQLWKPVVVAALAASLIAMLGAAATDLGPWYQSLKKPTWQPPDWLFGPAWTLIFGLTAMAAIVAWRRASRSGDRKRVIGLFALNALLNILWSLLFFRVKRPDWALIEVGLLWLSILLPMIVFARHAKAASALLMPYLIWVTFAAVLNLSVVRLNAPF